MSTLPLVSTGVGIAIVTLVGYVLITGIRRMLSHDGHIRLAQVLRARNLRLPRPVGDLEIIAAAHATRRCVACAEHKRCDLAIAERDWKTLAQICPNDEYIESRRSNRG